ncbi:hypothetical protein [Streptomyces sp. CCM_MD2014]|uniref:hypothetical protein n=1 Tax=Streptomyces sp. CCM_MD2014 TaxID=1561022 RepID=UPI00052AE6BB|nr:hypothetical protein [Streptomyces sp. CCM_MD2014]AIV35572.1 hypothetical protein NI25_20420 [Streptomyces sp. CCM_MD2014]
MRKIMLSVGAAVAAVGLVAGCSGDGGTGDAGKESTAATAGQEAGSGDSAKAAGEDIAKRDVKIVSSGVKDHDVWGPKAYVVAYEVTNGGKDDASYFVQLRFLDQDGDVLGTTGITADNVGPGKTNRGDTAPLESEITNGKIGDIRSVKVSTVDRMPVE